jgi:hypothetical protein
VALEMSDPTSGFGGRYVTVSQGRQVIEAQQHLMLAFTRLYFSHTQTRSPMEEHDATERERSAYLQHTGQYFSDVKRPLLTGPTVTAVPKKARFGTYAQQKEEELRKATLRSMV